MSDTDNSTIVTDPFHSCDEENKKKCLADIQKVRDNDSDYTALQWYDRHVGDDGAKVLSEALAENSSVTFISLSNNAIGNDGAKVLAEALKKNSSVTFINLRDNRISANGGMAIAEALAENLSVTEIHLAGNDIGDAGAMAIAEALKKNLSLTNKKKCLADIQKVRDNDPNYRRLDWYDRNVGADGAKVLAEALKKNSSVTWISLAINEIGTDGGKAIAEMLAENLSVTYINLTAINIGDDGAKAIAEALKKNSSVTSISLAHNEIGTDGGKAIAEMLAENLSVTSINLSSNKIGTDGAKAIAEALKKNSSVTDINLYYNEIGNDGAKAIAEALAENSSVTTIDLNRNSISPTNETLITSKIAINKVLKKHQKNSTTKSIFKRRRWDIRKNNDDTKRGLSYYIDGFSATSSPSHHDNKPQWKWTSAAWEAVNEGDGRVAQALLDCLKEDTNNNSDFRESLKQLAETDIHNKQKQSVLHIAAGQPYHKVFDLLKFFVEDCKVEIDLADEEERSIRDIAIANKNSDISAWARKFGTYLNRYRIEGGNGLNSEPVHESPTCVVYFAKDMVRNATNPDYEVALKIMFTKANFDRELQARVKNDVMRSITSGDDISKEYNMYDSDHVVPLYRYHNDATDKRGKPCWCLVFTKDLKSLLQITSLSYYIDGFSATSSPSHHDIKPQWKWTFAAWEAVNEGDERVAQVLLNCLKEDTNNNSNFRESLKKLVETDFHEKQKESLLHIVASNSHSKIIELLKFFIEDCKVKIDLTDEEGRSIRVIAIANKNREISAWARISGTYLNRYRIEGGSGLNSDPIHQSETCTVHFAIDMKKRVNDKDYHVAIKIMNNRKNFKRELDARLVTRDGIKAGDNIREHDNKYELDHVVSLYRFHDNAKDKDGNPCWCLILTKGLKSLHQIIDTERIAGKNSDKIVEYGRDLAKAIKHMHDKDTIHADIKPRNVIRASDGDIKLIDLDASVKVEDFLTVKKKSTAFISPEVAKIEFQPKETLDAVKNKMEEKKKERDALDIKAEYGETFDLLDEEIKVLRGKIIQIMNKSKETSLSNNTTSIPANFSLDIWGFGVTLYPLFTNKKHVFKANLDDDTLDGEDEQLRLVNWNGPSTKDLNKILLDDLLIQKNARAFFKKCLHHDVQERFQSMRGVLNDPLFKRADGDIEKIYKLVKEIPKQILNIKTIRCPYIFNFISEDKYKSFKEEKIGSNGKDSLEYAASLASKAKMLYAEAETLMGEKFPQKFKDSKTFKGFMSKVRKRALGEEKTHLYLQILDGVTFEPVLSYKVSRKAYPDQVESASRVGVKICNVLQNLSFISKTASLMGYPIPDISKVAGIAESFLTDVIKSGEEAKYITSLNFDGGGFESLAELDKFETLLNGLVKKGKLRFFRDEEVLSKSEESKESWGSAMVQTYFQSDDDDDSFVTWIDKRNSDKLENYKKSI